MNLTRKQIDAYQFIAGYIREHGISPTMDEIAKAVGYKSRGNVHALTQRIIDRGLLKRNANVARGLELVPPASSISLPSRLIDVLDSYAKEHGIKRETAAAEAISAYCGKAA